MLDTYLVNCSVAATIILMAIGLAGCAISETVYLQNASSQTVQCGPYTDYGDISSANVTTQNELRDCITDYQRQGYERVPDPQISN